MKKEEACKKKIIEISFFKASDEIFILKIEIFFAAATRRD